MFNLVYSPDYIILLFHRLFMTHGQAAHDPEVHRVCECVCIRLLKEFQQARNRPKDTQGKTLPISTIYCGGIQPLETAAGGQQSCSRTD